MLSKLSEILTTTLRSGVQTALTLPVLALSPESTDLSNRHDRYGDALSPHNPRDHQCEEGEAMSGSRRGVGKVIIEEVGHVVGTE